MEVVYTACTDPGTDRGSRHQEDADAVGLSILSGAHMTLVSSGLELLGERDARDIVVSVAHHPQRRHPRVEKMGVATISHAGATHPAIVGWSGRTSGSPSPDKKAYRGSRTGAGHGGGDGRTLTRRPLYHDARRHPSTDRASPSPVIALSRSEPDQRTAPTAGLRTVPTSPGR